MRITRRELLTMVAAAAAARCRGSRTPSNEADRSRSGEEQQPPKLDTVTLVVSGMV